MLPKFLIEETTVRESGESNVLDFGPIRETYLSLTFGITHAVEQESIEIEVFGSEDGRSWPAKPLLGFPPKCYCGAYTLALSDSPRFLKVAWRTTRWGRGDQRPFFRFYLFAQPVEVRAMAGVA